MVNVSVMLAEEYQPSKAEFPYLATPKLDGIRFYVDANHLFSRSNKPIPNIPLQRETKHILSDCIDGEICAGSTYNESSSFAMSDMKPIEGNGVVIHIFDLIIPRKSYMDRMATLAALRAEYKVKGWKKNKSGIYRHPSHSFGISFVFPVWLETAEAVDNYFQQCLSAGHEGIILRVPASEYVPGRQKTLLKFKPYIEREAVILGCEEMMTNANEAYTDEIGRTKRSTAIDGKIPAGILGSFHVRDIETDIDFYVGNGNGLTHILRADLWQRRFDLPGLVIKYRSMAHSAYEKPRQPQFLGFRDRRDM